MESEWLSRQPYLAIDPTKQPHFTAEEIKAAAEDFAWWLDERKHKNINNENY